MFDEAQPFTMKIDIFHYSSNLLKYDKSIDIFCLFCEYREEISFEKTIFIIP